MLLCPLQCLLVSSSTMQSTALLLTPLLVNVSTISKPCIALAWVVGFALSTGSLSLLLCQVVTDGCGSSVHLSCLGLTVSSIQKNWNLIKTNWLSWEWQHRQEWWVCRREGSTIHGTAVMSWNSPSVGVAGKCWAGKAKVSPAGLVWGERSAESSSKATDKDGGRGGGSQLHVITE